MERGLSPSKERSSYAPFTQKAAIQYWQSLLGLDLWQIKTVRISEMQVLDDYFDALPGHEFVGVCIDNESLCATIYHTRKLLDDDILHELLHVRFQDWTEDEVVHCTAKLQASVDHQWIVSEVRAAV